MKASPDFISQDLHNAQLEAGFSQKLDFRVAKCNRRRDAGVVARQALGSADRRDDSCWRLVAGERVALERYQAGADPPNIEAAIVMRRGAIREIRFALGLAALLWAFGCEPAPAPAAVASAADPAAAAVLAPAWLTDRSAYPLLAMSAPAFSADLSDGGKVSEAALRGHWTILAFWGLWSDDSIADAKYLRALASAADADPDLNFLSIHTPPGPGRAADALGSFRSLDSWFAEQGGPWPTALDTDGKIAAAFHVTSAPVYLLIGPDLTIEGYRTQLASTPDDGIKPVIKGYADIRKHVASPN